MLYREAVMWKRLDHPNIVPFKGVTLDPLRVVSEWMPGGDLTGYISQNPQTNRIRLVSPAGPCPKRHLSYLPVDRYREGTRPPPSLRRGSRGPQRSELLITANLPSPSHQNSVA